MSPILELAADADAAADGANTGGVQIHVDITPLSTPGPVPTPSPIDGLAGTGADLPVLLIAAGILLLVVGTAIVVRRVRNRSSS
ncbi:hypothetical protein ACI3KS_17370 [Microbacterium sp. ZW T5_45]|uniref:hypothetical protein n=1 Tax=Microbacterium sp. ZW T5_45 TaxID=3378080 RepID=UPI00385530A0